MTRKRKELRPAQQQLVVIHRTEDKPRGRWDDAERAAKVLSIVAIPLVVAIVGWQLQDSLNKRTVSQDYVSLAVSILKERESDAGLRSWAVDLLNTNSPTQFVPEVSQRLRDGVLRLPVSPSLAQAMANADAAQIVRKILDEVGLVPNFILVPSDIPTASAAMQDGKRILLYNPGFIQSVNRDAGTNWAAVAVLAHEIGHHVLGHMFLQDAGPELHLELEAYSFSGFMLYRLGATLDQAVAVFKTIPDDLPTPYGSQAERAGAVSLGWKKAQAGGTAGPQAK